MQIPKQAVLLRIFIGENDRFEDTPLHEAIVMKARELHLAGATVLRGPIGYGMSSRLHTAKMLRLSEDLPLVIEIVDSEENINNFLPILNDMMSSGLVTLEKVQVLHAIAGNAALVLLAVCSRSMLHQRSRSHERCGPAPSDERHVSFVNQPPHEPDISTDRKHSDLAYI
jgi:PII-like signaling protein